MTAVLVTGPTTVQKRAICWLDVLVFAIVLTVVFGLWGFADRSVREAREENRPTMEASEHSRNLPLLQAELTMAQDELKALYGKLFETRMQVTRLVADLRPLPHNPRAKLLSPQRGLRIELLKARHLVQAYEAELPEKIKQVISATEATQRAKRSAEIAYIKVMKEFDSANRAWVLAIVAACWSLLTLATAVACRLLHRTFGHGSGSHVLVPGTALIVTASLYYWFAK